MPQVTQAWTRTVEPSDIGEDGEDFTESDDFGMSMSLSMNQSFNPRAKPSVPYVDEDYADEKYEDDFDDDYYFEAKAARNDSKSNAGNKNRKSNHK